MSSSVSPLGFHKFPDDKVEKLRRQLQVIERQTAEQSLLMKQLEELASLKNTHLPPDPSSTWATEPVTNRYTNRYSSLGPNVTNRYSSLGQNVTNRYSSLGQNVTNRYSSLGEHALSSLAAPPSKEVEKILMERTRKFQESQKEKAANLEYLTQQRNKIVEARMKLKQQQNVMSSILLPTDADIIMRSPSKRQVDNQYLGSLKSDRSSTDFMQTLRQPWDPTQDWSSLGKTAVNLVAEEILLEVTSLMTSEAAMECFQQGSMFQQMSENLFIKEAEAQATGNSKGWDLNDPAFNLITQMFQTLKEIKDQSTKNVWIHSQTLSHLAIPPPATIVRNSGSEPHKQPGQKNKKKPQS